MWAERCQAEAMGAIVFGDRETPECSSSPVTERNGYSLCDECASRLDRRGSLAPAPSASVWSTNAMVVSAFVGAFLLGPMLACGLVTFREGVVVALSWSVGVVMGKRVVA